MLDFSKILLLFLCVLPISGCVFGSYDGYNRGAYSAPQSKRLPEKVERVMLYMEQWDALAQHISDEILCGLGKKRIMGVSGSGVTPFKKGLRELLITALTRRGVTVVDAESGLPVLEFDVLPVSQGQTNLYIGMRNKPTQIMVNISIFDNGQYIYRSSSIHAVPGEDLYQYVEEETLQTAPFKSYQLVAS